MITIRLLGVIDVRDAEGREASAVLSQPKRLALLAYLATPIPGGHHRRDTLLGLFWPDLDSEHARNALSKAVYFLREALGADAIVSRSTDELALDPAKIWTDVGAFEGAIAASQYEEALRLYQGDLLPAVYFSDSAPFEHWLEETRTRLRSRAVRAARQEAERQEAARNFTLAIDIARRGAELSQDDERTLRRLLSLLHRLGDHAGALSMYERFARRLADDLGASPSPETVALIQEIRAACSPRSPSPPESPPPSDLPSASSPLSVALGDRYQVIKEIGSGSSARVYLAEDRKLRREVAIKVLRPTLTGMGQAAKFEAEILVAARLNHPHLVPLLDAGEAAGLLYYVMPHVAGETLRERLDRTGQLPIAEALSIAREVADALSYAHGRGFVHRDIKPENILLADGHALVTDFGIARALSSAPGPGEPGSGSGTPTYASPEQVDASSPEDGRADIYSLGCVLYELLAGRPPFQAETVSAMLDHHRGTPPPALSEFRPDVPPLVAALVARSLAKRPVDRPADAAAFLASLHAISEVGPRPPGLKGRIWTAVGVGVTVMVSGLGWWILGSHSIAPSRRPQLLLADVDAGPDTAIGHTLTEALRADLTGSTRYQLVSAQRTRATLKRMGRGPGAELDDTTAHEIAIREGIPMVATVSVSRFGDRYQVIGGITDPNGDGPQATRITVEAESLLIYRISELARRLRVMAGERRSVTLDRAGLPRMTTNSLKALELYASVVRVSSDGAGGPIEPLEMAVGLDPGFAAAHRLLSVRYLQQRRFSDARRALAAAQRHRDRLTAVEQGLLDATAAALSGWTDTLALRSALDRVLAIDPQNWTALVNRANYESWHQDPRKAEAFAARALALDPSHPGGWLVLFWSRLQRGDSSGAAAALEEGTRLAGGPAPYLHEWSIYGWRFGDYSRAERQLDSLARIPGIADSVREDYPIIGNSVAFLRGRHHEAEAGWARFAARLPPSRGSQIRASTLFREAQCLALARIPPAQIQRHLARRSTTIDLTGIEVNERESVRNYLAGAWAWAGAPAKARELLAVERRPDSLLIPWVLHTRTLSELLILVAEGRDAEVIARSRTLPRSAQLGILALPTALAFDRSGNDDSVLAAGTRFFGRRTFIAIASDLGCAEQILRVRMGEILEARGDKAGARRYYDRYLRTWPNPEPEFRERTRQVRQRLAALGVGTDQSR